MCRHVQTAFILSALLIGLDRVPCPPLWVGMGRENMLMQSREHGTVKNYTRIPESILDEKPVSTIKREADCANTFSIVAYDPDRKEWGVAVASKYLAVGSAVPFAKAGVGAIATQSFVNILYGPKGLDLLAQGKSAKDVVQQLTDADDGKASRQLGIVDANGEAATFTGDKCLAWAGGKTGKHYACQGNILTGEDVVAALAETFEKTKGPLAWRLMAALEAGEKAGGDKRGKQSAAILVVRDGDGPNRMGDRYIDLRVDDHQTPVQELARILALHPKARKPVD